MPSNNSKYSPEMRGQTACFVIESNRSATSVAQEMGIDTNTVCRWTRDFRRIGTRYDYLYGPNSMPLQLMVTASNGTTSTYAYQVDHGGSVIGMTDEDGDEVARYAYDPYGGLVGISGDPIATRNPLRYRGYYYDNETQLYYLPARYYNPDTARFLSVDPAPPSAGDPTSLNAYLYCFGDPVQFTDPTGATADMDGDDQRTAADRTAQEYIQNPTETNKDAAQAAYDALVATGSPVASSQAAWMVHAGSTPDRAVQLAIYYFENPLHEEWDCFWMRTRPTPERTRGNGLVGLGRKIAGTAELLGSAGWVVSGVIDFGIASYDGYWALRDKATWGDVAWDLVCILPVVGLGTALFDATYDYGECFYGWDCYPYAERVMTRH